MKTEELTSAAETEISRRFQDVKDRVSETAKNIGQETDRYVHDNPWRIVALAAVIGCVVGFLIGNNRS